MQATRMLVAAGMLAGCAAQGSDDDRSDDVSGSVGDSCSETADTCTADAICVLDTCLAAFGRTYTIRDVVVHSPTTNLSGDVWDLADAPDLKLEIFVNGAVVAASPAVPDQFMATFAGPYDVTLIEGTTLLLAALDEDVTADDAVLGCQASPISAAQLRSRSLSCGTGDSRLSFEIDPR